ncbi:MAG: hypothetical protein AVDCRST_MAG28-2143, partial [uncultured Rubrobacteraceae bacterium]
CSVISCWRISFRTAFTPSRTRGSTSSFTGRSNCFFGV